MKTAIESTMKIDLYKVIWLFIHFVANTIEFLVNSWNAVKLKIVEIWNKNHKNDWKLTKQLLEVAQNDLEKIPVHLAVVLGQEEPNFQILSNVIYWCLSLGIQHVSFYDHKGKQTL